MEVCKWRNVGMSEKPAVELVYVMPALNSSFAVNSLCKDLATVVHSGAQKKQARSREISDADVCIAHSLRKIDAQRNFRSAAGLSCQSADRRLDYCSASMRRVMVRF